VHAQDRLGTRQPEHLLRIHAELPLDRITTVLAGWLRKLEPLGHGNPEPVFVARKVRLAGPARIMRERHVRMELVQDAAGPARPSGVVRAVGWDWAARVAALDLSRGSLIDIAYRIRQNEHPDFGGLEVEIAGIRPAEA
jgi:single-stranded-DNA-specific exonuclease